MTKAQKLLVSLFLAISVIALFFWRLSVYTAQQRQEQLNKAMMDAVMTQNIADVRDLLRRGADPNGIQQPATWKEGLEDKFSESIVRHFDPLYSRPAYFTPLVLAMLNPNPDVVQALLAAGAKVNQKDSLGETSLELAEVNDGGKIYLMLKNADAKQKANH